MRSVYLARDSHPWLAAAYHGALEPSDFNALHAAMVQQTAAEAAAAGRLLLRTFHELLANLIGQALAEQLLGPAAGQTSGGHAARDTSP